ncbi:MAG: helix-turn-helix transcriptional regulator [Bauldia sp.]|nr:helix-turn-helix transcriptional regulator [Bauldia sp.]
MTKQVIVTPSGERMVVLPEAEYNALVEAAEDAEDLAAVAGFEERLARGEEELVPAAMVDRILGGDNPVRVWREHRGLTATALAEKAGIAQSYLSQIETGRRDGTVATYRRIAEALGVTVDDLI